LKIDRELYENLEKNAYKFWSFELLLEYLEMKDCIEIPFFTFLENQNQQITDE